MYTIGQLASEFGLSRSTLLYYDKQGLLSPSSRSTGNYRLYTKEDFEQLKQIVIYRQAGLSLKHIAELLKTGSSNNRTIILESQLQYLNQQIAELRSKQQVILSMLDNKLLTQTTRSMNKSQWVKLLKSIGLSNEDMKQWHIEFEHNMPEAHEDFLQSLNIPSQEIREIRKWSRQGIKNKSN